MLIRSYATGIE